MSTRPFEGGEEFPPYLTVRELVNGWHVDLMRYDTKQEEYMVAKTTFPMGKEEQAQNWAKAWSEREGIEIR